ncbi:hypothetical protein FORC065_3359 [Yersinia enterocolitica]|nr:hypothetical protein FORC065_3359 [Yersinia enterocolitica]
MARRLCLPVLHLKPWSLKSHKFNQLKSAITIQYNIIVLAAEGQ